MQEKLNPPTVSQERWNATFDMVQIQQTIGVRRLVRFGIVMGIALAGQILVTLTLGTVSWMQQHVFFLVLVELIWWPPFFCILYFSFIGVVKLVEFGTGAHKQLRRQFTQVCQDYENRCMLYEQRLQEKERHLRRLSLVAKEKIHTVRLEPFSGDE